MSSMEPFEQLTGTLQIYVANAGTAIPDVDATPNGSWRLLGATDGEQSVQNAGALTYFRDNDHQGPVKAVRPEEDVIYTFILVGLTLENWAAVLHDAANVSADAGPPAVKRMAMKRGATPKEYTLLFRGEALSPYGVLPGQFVAPRGVFDGEPTATFAKDGRPGLECEFRALEDDSQADPDDSLGWLEVQTS